MATVTFTAGPKTKNYTISAGSLTRLSNWAAAVYPTIPNPNFGQPGEPATISNPEPVLSAFDALFAGVKANVRRYEDSLSQAAIVPAGDLT